MPNVIVINPFEVPKGREEEALAAWDRAAAYLSSRPGFVSAKLHRSIDPSARFQLVTVGEWASAERFMAALTSEGMSAAAEGLAPFPHNPGMYEVIRG
jgi:heme-degrading monooxygenase HmoA